MNKHLEYPAEAQKLTEDNPELHAEYQRRRKAGEWFKPGEPVTAYMQRLIQLNHAFRVSTYKPHGLTVSHDD